MSSKGYAEALRRINEAVRSGTNQLDLSQLELTSLPPEIGGLTGLTTLGLSGNQLTALPPEIGGLAGLTTLGLYGNRLTALPPEIVRLAGLTTLGLSRNQLTALPPEIGGLAGLTTLNLFNNQLAALPPEIGGLAGLTALGLSGNQLTALPPEIGGLTGLTTLDLFNNRLTALPPEIGGLTGLTALNLSHNQLTALPPEIGGLAGLTMLNLFSNQLTALPPEIGGLAGLTTLGLYGNRLTALPPEIGGLAGLTTLDLAHNRLTALPPEIGGLTGLTTLDLAGNQLTALPPEIGGLAGLTTLNLSHNQLTALPPEIGGLAGLTALDLFNNQLTALPPEIGGLTGLTTLGLSGNQLTALPPEIGGLAGLTTLNLFNNRLAALPPEIRFFSDLTHLILENNQLASLPESIVNLSSLQELTLHGNEKLGLPPEVLGPTYADSSNDNPPAKPADILKYYFATRKGSKSLREIKLILVGRGEVGKSTLADALQGKPFKKNRARTDGISITRWSVKPKGGAAIIRIWDFGGQEIMHGTHQFFLTQRAIYILMVDGRDDRSQREAEYWLKHVRAFGGDSTVMVVMNRQKAYKFDLDRKALASKYGVSTDLFFPTECSKKATITPVARAIVRLAESLLKVQSNFPERWWPVKSALETMKDDYLSEARYQRLCEQHGITESDEQQLLLARLSELGTIVHFPDDHMADLKVLDPEWATDGVYRVVTNEALREEKHGKLKASSLKDILKERWPDAAHRRYILDLMLKFELCFPAENEDSVYIVPDLLPKQSPDLTGWKPEKCVVFRYKYPVLPHAILPRFISKTHKLSEGRERWRSGVVIGRDAAEAIVRADYDDAVVDVWVRGAHRDANRALLDIIREKFDEIHGRFRDLKPEELVAVPGHPTVFVPYRDMILDERRSKQTVAVTIDGERLDVQIDSILSGVESSARRRQAADAAYAKGESIRPPRTIICDTYNEGDELMDIDNSTNIGGNVYNSQVGQTLTNCTNMVNQQAPGPKKDAMDQLRREVEDLLKRLPEDKMSEAPQVVEKLETAIKEAAKQEPDQEWYSLSTKGLMKAAGWVSGFTDKIGMAVKSLGTLLWTDFKLPI